MQSAFTYKKAVPLTTWTASMTMGESHPPSPFNCNASAHSCN